jgi:hypothetical protein
MPKKLCDTLECWVLKLWWWLWKRDHPGDDPAHIENFLDYIFGRESFTVGFESALLLARQDPDLADELTDLAIEDLEKRGVYEPENGQEPPISLYQRLREAI